MEYIEQRLALHIRELREKKVAIFPFGTIGLKVKNILNSSYNVTPNACVDNFSKETNVITLKEFINNEYSRNKNNYKVVFTAKSPGLFRSLFKDMITGGISAKDIIIIYCNELYGSLAIEYIINNTDSYKTVLDIGCGDGLQACIFEQYGLNVTCISLTRDSTFIGNPNKLVIGDFMQYEGKPVDVVWTSHVLEHIQTVPDFLERMKKFINPGGCLAITVPNNEKNIHYEHIHQFNGGRVLRYLLLSGYDCTDAKIITYGYNLSVILPHVKYIPDNWSEEIKRQTIFNYLPPEIVVHRSWNGDCIINGDINECNWYVYPKIRI